MCVQFFASDWAVPVCVLVLQLVCVMCECVCDTNWSCIIRLHVSDWTVSGCVWLIVVCTYKRSIVVVVVPSCRLVFLLLCMVDCCVYYSLHPIGPSYVVVPSCRLLVIPRPVPRPPSRVLVLQLVCGVVVSLVVFVVVTSLVYLSCVAVVITSYF